MKRRPVRRLATRDEKLARNYQALLALAATVMLVALEHALMRDRLTIVTGEFWTG